MSAIFPVVEDPRWRRYTAAEGQTVFTIPFVFQDNADLAITKIAIDGTRTVLAEPADMAITGAGTYPAGGQVTLTTGASAGEIIEILGDANMARTVSVVRNGRFSSKAIDDDVDRNRIIAQEQARDIGRSLKMDLGETVPSPLKPEASKLIGWNAAGDDLENKAAIDLGLETLPAVASTFLQRNAANSGFVALSPAETNAALGTVQAVPTRAALAALDVSSGTVAILSGSIFAYVSSDLSAILTPGSVTTTAVDSGTETCTKTAHGLLTGQPVYPTTSVNGLTAETIYYVIKVDADSFKLATSYLNAMAGTAVDLTGTTNFTVKRFIDPAEAVYVIPNGAAVDGSEGAWVRRHNGTIDIGWAGGSAGADISTALAAARSVLSMLNDGGRIRLPGSSSAYLMTAPVHFTDTSIIVEGDGEDATTVQASGSTIDMFIFDTNTTLSGDRVRSGGLLRMNIDGNSIAERCVKTVSTNYGYFDFLRIQGATQDNFLATTQNGQPSSQHNHYGTIEILTAGSANGFHGTGSQDAGANGNWSMNHIENMYTVMGGSTPSGHGLLFGFSDGNYVNHFRNYAPAGATGYGVKFSGDDSGVVTGGAHARLNVIAHCQPGVAGVLAEAGTSYSSANEIINYSLGNGSPSPTVESGAYLGYTTYYNGRRNDFTPTLFGSSTAGSPTYTTQKGRFWIVGNMLHFAINIAISATGGMAGNIKIGGFPFSASSSGNNPNIGFAPSKIKCNLTANYYSASGVMQGGQDSFFLFQNGPGQAPAAITAGLIPSDFQIEISGAYPIINA